MAGIKVKTMNIDDYKDMAKPIRKLGHERVTLPNGGETWATSITVAPVSSAASIDRLDSAIMALPEILRLCQAQQEEIERLQDSYARAVSWALDLEDDIARLECPTILDW